MTSRWKRIATREVQTSAQRQACARQVGRVSKSFTHGKSEQRRTFAIPTMSPAKTSAGLQSPDTCKEGQ